MLTVDELVGVWVEHNVGGLGPSVLILCPDQRGAIDYYNPTFAGRDEFRWHLLDGGTRIRIDPSMWCTDTVEVSCFVRGNDRVLRLEFDFPPNEALGISGGHATCDHYLSALSVTDYVPPTDEET